MYIPNKPAKYGIKIVMICDVATKYVLDAIPYLGKSTNTGGKPLALYIVEELVSTINGSNRNITMDNWFTSVELANHFLQSHGCTILGTIRKNKRQIPQQLLEMNKSRSPNTSIFVYDKNLTMVSYKPKQNKNVLLLSSMHTEGGINENTKKPYMIEYYNSTKGAVDTVDQMCSGHNTSRKTKRWPMAIFFNIINLSIVYGYVIYSNNITTRRMKPMNKIDYMITVQEKLTESWQKIRLIKPVSREIRAEIEKSLGTEEATIDTSDATAIKKRKYCVLCHYSKRRYTKITCSACKKPICGEHQKRHITCLHC